MKKLWKIFVKIVVNPVWIINEKNEGGFRIWGVNFYFYKDSKPFVYMTEEYSFRETQKREFGESFVVRDRQIVG